MNAEDRRFLGLALELAVLAEGRTRPNPMVGSIVVKEGRILGKGFHSRAGEEHAEVLAISEAGSGAAGATLYSSLEPCCHHGRTPPCVGRIIQAGIRRVVCCTQDPDPRVNGRGLEALGQAGIEVEAGILAAEARRLNEAFFSYKTRGRPLVCVKAAMGLDGRISAPGGGSRWVSSPAARAEAMLLRSRHDAVLVGIGTVLRDDPALTVREPARPRPIVRVVLDSALRLPPACRMLSEIQAGEVLVYHASGVLPERARALEGAGATVILAGGGPGVDPVRVVEDLASREIMNVLVEGGGTVIGAFLAMGLADRLALFVSPRVLGEGGSPVVSGWGGEGLEAAPRFRWTGVRKVGADLLIEARPGLE